MAIVSKPAFQTSDGQLFRNEKDAYLAEMKYLWDRLLVLAKQKRAFTPHELDRRIAEIRVWMKSCSSVREEIGGEHEASVQAQIALVEAWLAEGEALQKKFKQNPDIAVQLAQQG